jgi:hypothetical protein
MYSVTKEVIYFYLLIIISIIGLYSYGIMK